MLIVPVCILRGEIESVKISEKDDLDGIFRLRCENEKGTEDGKITWKEIHYPQYSFVDF